MKFSGEYLIPATREDVWVALQDPEILQECIDGCEQMTSLDTNECESLVRVKLGPVRAKFRSIIRMLNVTAPESYTLAVNARGGNAGFGIGQANITLTPNEAGTTLCYEVTGTVSGKLAQLGSRLFLSAANKMASSFFTKFCARWDTIQ